MLFSKVKSYKFSWNYIAWIAKELFQVNIGSGYGLVPSGSKPSPEPMLTKMYVAI